MVVVGAVDAAGAVDVVIEDVIVDARNVLPAVVVVGATVVVGAADDWVLVVLANAGDAARHASATAPPTATTGRTDHQRPRTDPRAPWFTAVMPPVSGGATHDARFHRRT